MPKHPAQAQRPLWRALVEGLGRPLAASQRRPLERPSAPRLAWSALPWPLQTRRPRARSSATGCPQPPRHTPTRHTGWAAPAAAPACLGQQSGRMQRRLARRECGSGHAPLPPAALPPACPATGRPARGQPSQARPLQPAPGAPPHSTAAVLRPRHYPPPPPPHLPRCLAPRRAQHCPRPGSTPASRRRQPEQPPRPLRKPALAHAETSPASTAAPTPQPAATGRPRRR